MPALHRKERTVLQKRTVENVKKRSSHSWKEKNHQRTIIVRAIQRSRPYILSDRYKVFEVDSVKWYSMDPESEMKHVEQFQRYSPVLDDQFAKPKSSGRKPSDRKPTRKPDFEGAFDRLDKESRKQFTFQEANAREKVL